MPRSLSFTHRVFALVAGATVATTLAVAMIIYVSWVDEKTNDFVSRYDVLSQMLATTFYHLEENTDATSHNALFALQTLMDAHGLYSDAELAELAPRLGVNSFYVINPEGRFLRSSDLPIEQQVNSIFDYCADYKNMLTGAMNEAQTPVLPGFPHDIPQKFLMVPNASRTLILEASTNLEYISRILHKVAQQDDNIRFIGLYAPNGYELGSIDASGAFRQGQRGAPTATWYGKQASAEEMTFRTKIQSTVGDCCECKMKGTASEGEPYHYALQISASLAPLHAQIATLRMKILGVLGVALSLALALSHLVAKRLLSGLRQIGQTASAIVETGDLDLRVPALRSHDEIAALADAINKLVSHLQDSRTRLVETARIRSIARLASQVAHDIRSPLAALDASARYMDDVSEEQRMLVRAATRRINDIANNLLSQYRGQPTDSDTAASPQPEPIATLVNSIVSEKRAQFAKQDVDIGLTITDAAQHVFAVVARAGLLRVLSNLINNAVEASGAGAQVDVRLDVNAAAKIVVTIQDNGCGIAPDKIATILRGGYTSKAGGTGIGLSSSVEQLRLWQGEVHIASQVGQGTELTFTLPACAAPSWFASAVVVDPARTIVVLDDEKFIATMWQQRLVAECGKPLHIVTFRRCSDFVTYLTAHRESIGLCLIDYEFLDDKRNGIDLIEQLDISDMAILVTSHVEEDAVRVRSAQLGLKILPKNAAVTIPIRTVQVGRGVLPRAHQA